MNKEQALAIYLAGQDVVVQTLLEMDQRLTLLEKTVKDQAKLIAKLSKDSSNSSKPPSSDNITQKKKPKKKKKRKIGGQKGHMMHERPSYPVEDIDHFHEHRLENCPICNKTDILFLAHIPPRTIQQVELQKVAVETHEHRCYAYWCASCQQVHYAVFPPEVVKEGLFKSRITALVAYMSKVCHASFSTIRKFIRDILGENVSRGYLAKVIEKVSQSLEKPYEELLARLPLERTLNVDETGHKENGDRFWTWVFKADLYMLFKIDKSRGSKVLTAVLGKEFDGVIGCDYFSAYRKYMKDFNVPLQFCIAHLIRDIKYLISLPDSETNVYGAALLKQIKDMFKIIHDRGNMSHEEFTAALEKSRQRIMLAALDNVPSHINKDGKEEKREAQNMAKRFRDHGQSYFRFITTPGIDPTNNIAEQAIRFIVIDRRITQGTRSQKGRKRNERLWTVIGTCALQGKSAFEFILKAIEAHFGGQPAPSLLFDSG
jgi:hypothetical protein